MTDAWHDPNYDGREQSYIKHIMLEKYLQKLGLIVCQHAWSVITYIDGFSGPWEVKSEQYDDSSFAIALKQLRDVKIYLKNNFGREIQIRGLFLEKETKAFGRLQEFAENESQGTEVHIEAWNEQFELVIPRIIRFIKEGGTKAFPFIFIDPKGWKGYPMDVISEMLRMNPCEVLINFMSSFISRFIESSDPELEAGLQQLFGDRKFLSRLEGKTGLDRTDTIVFTYAENLGRICGFPYVQVAVVPKPEKNWPHFHLIYATRNIAGVKAFKEAERTAFHIAPKVYAEAKKRNREQQGQQELFGGDELPDTAYLEYLTKRYTMAGRDAVHNLIRSRKSLPFDDVYCLAMRYPLVTTDDVRFWIREIADFRGFQVRQKQPKLNSGNQVQLREES